MNVSNKIECISRSFAPETFQACNATLGAHWQSGNRGAPWSGRHRVGRWYNKVWWMREKALYSASVVGTRCVGLIRKRPCAHQRLQRALVWRSIAISATTSHGVKNRKYYLWASGGLYHDIFLTHSTLAHVIWALWHWWSGWYSYLATAYRHSQIWHDYVQLYIEKNDDLGIIMPDYTRKKKNSYQHDYARVYINKAVSVSLFKLGWNTVQNTLKALRLC